MNLLGIQAVRAALIDFYLEGLRYQLNEKPGIFLAQLERNSSSVVGRDIVMALRHGRVGGSGMRADDGVLPRPRARQTTRATWETKNFFSRFQITDKTIRASKGNKGAFADLLTTEIADNETDAKQDLSRQALTDEYGLLAEVVALDPAGGGVTEVEVDNILYFAPGMSIQAYVGSTDVPRNSVGAVDEVYIEDVDRANSYIYLDQEITDLAAADELFVFGNREMELTGIASVMDDATLYNINRANNRWMNPIQDAVGGAISETVIQWGIDESDIRAGGEINFIYTSHGVKRAYQALLTAQKRLTNTMDLKGGYKTISYNDIPIASDKYAPAGRMRMLDLNNWSLYEMADWDWMDRDGAMLSRVAGRPAYEATLLKYCDLGCDKPGAQVELTGIDEA